MPTIQDRFRCRRGTAAALAAANEVPLDSEIVLESDTGLGKIGDGVTHYASLPYRLIGNIDLAGVAPGKILTRDPSNAKWVIGDLSGSVVWNDLFSVNIASRYTSLAQSTLGSWAMGGGQLSGTGGAQAIFLPSNATFADGYVESAMAQANDGGIVARVADANNYYLLKVSDGSVAATPSTFTLYKCFSGTFSTIIPSQSIPGGWLRGNQKTFRLRCAGTTLTVLIDGVSVATVTDATFAWGLFGCRNTGSGVASYFRSLRAVAL